MAVFLRPASTSMLYFRKVLLYHSTQRSSDCSDRVPSDRATHRRFFHKSAADVAGPTCGAFVRRNSSNGHGPLFCAADTEAVPSPPKRGKRVGNPARADTTGRCCMWMQRHGYQMPGCPRKRAITSASRAGIDVIADFVGHNLTCVAASRAGQGNLASGAAGGSPAPITGESTP